jgi:hypothetical protein
MTVRAADTRKIGCIRPKWDLVGGNHQGQRPCATPKQAELKTASDELPSTKKELQKWSHPHRTK